MSERAIGSRVGAILSMDEESVYLLGYGVYSGKHKPPDFPISNNPKLTLDNGSVVWGYQCWWGGEQEVKKAIGDRKIYMVDVDGNRINDAEDNK